MIKLLQGDCLELLKDVPDGSVDLVLTDPPYCVGTTSNGSNGNFLDNNLIRPFWRTLFSEYQRVCKQTAALYIHTDWRTYPFQYLEFRQFFNMRNLIVWDYEWIKTGNHYRFSHEFIMYGTMPECRCDFSRKERDVWRILPINYTDPKKFHKSQKPVEICEKAIHNSSKPGDLVLDTFMGSGTTGVACINTGRNFIGMELDNKYFQIAQKRIETAEKALCEH